MRYWRLGTRASDGSADWWPMMRASHIVAFGWGDLGDLSQLIGDSERLREMVRRKYPENDPAYVCRQSRLFVTSIQVGDIVVAAHGFNYLGIGQVTSAYTYSQYPDPRAPHHRRVEWLWLSAADDPRAAPIPPGRRRPEGYLRTVAELKDPVTLSAIRSLLSSVGRVE